MQSDDERLLELINLVQDGQATPEQQADLQAILAESPRARDLDSGARELQARLEAMKRLDPPADLKPAVMEHVRGGGQVQPMTAASSRRRRFTMAWAAAAGLVLLFLIIHRPGQVHDETAALMAPAAEWPIVETLEAEPDKIVIRQKGNLYSIQPRISGPYPVTLVMEWDASAATLVAIPPGPDASSSVHKAEFILRGADDPASVMIRRTGEQPVEIRVAVAGDEVIRAELPLE